MEVNCKRCWFYFFIYLLRGDLAADERCPRVLVVKPERGGAHSGR